MPVLRLSLLEDGVVTRVFLHLQDEPYLRWVTEVGHSQQTHLLDEWVPRQLQFVPALLQQVLQRHWLQLHDTPDTQSLSPLPLVQVTQYVFHIHCPWNVLRFWRILHFLLESFQSLYLITLFTLERLLTHHYLLHFPHNRQQFLGCALYIRHRFL